MEVPRELLNHRLYPSSLLVLCGLLALTVCVGLIRSRYVLRVVEFTRTQVRLESRARVRTVPIADLMAVRIAHSGDTDRGYQETSLHLEWRGGGKWLVYGHDPTVGEALVKLLPSGVVVDERWEELQEPSTG